jgi:hypothetical protein
MAKEWKDCTKAAITKQFFPNVKERLKLQIDINPIFTALVTEHGKTRAYLRRFKILEQANVLAKMETKRQNISLISAHYSNHNENFLGGTS